METQVLEQITALLTIVKGLQGEMKTLREEAMPKLKAWDSMGLGNFNETAPKDDKGALLFGDITSIAKGLNELQGKMNDALPVLKELELKAQAPKTHAEKREIVKSVGLQIAEGKDFQDWLAKQNDAIPERSPHFPVKGFLQKTAANTVVFDTDEAGGTNVMYSEQVDIPVRVPLHRTLLRTLPLEGAQQIKFDQQTKRVVCVAALTATTSSGAAIFAVDSSQGFSAADKFSNVTVRHGSSSVTQDMVISSVDNANQITMTTNAAADFPAGSTIEAEYWIATPEAELKPQHIAKWTEQTVTTRKLAATIKITTEVMRSKRRIADAINRQLLEALALDEEWMVLWGPGTNEITGLMIDANIPTVTQTASQTKLDMLLYALTVVEVANYSPTTAWMSPTDYRDMLLSKGDDGHYVFGEFFLTGRPVNLMGLQIVRSSAMQPDNALVGDFLRGATFFYEEDATVQVGYVNDDFSKNKRTLLAENPINLTIDRPDAFCKIAFI